MSKRSWVWEEFQASKKHENKAVCNRCGVEVSNVEGSTSAMIKHLRIIHKIESKEKNDAVAASDSTSDRASVSGASFTKKQSVIEIFFIRRSLSETVARLAAVDGLTIRQITKSDFIRESIQSKFNKALPKNETGVMKLVMEEFNLRKNETKKRIESELARNVRYGVTLDEYTSLRNRRYINVNLHDGIGQSINLGLIRIDKAGDADTIEQLVKRRLSDFGVGLDKHIVACTGDGASVMIKFGRQISVFYQQCINHGIHLAVIDTLYDIQNDTEPEPDEENDFDDYSEDENCNDEDMQINFKNFTISETIKKVRKIVKIFKLSPVKNSVLQEKVKKVEGHEVSLKLDVRTRWNSLVDMGDTFLRLKESIIETLHDLNLDNLLCGLDFELLQEVCKCLRPLKLGVEALSRDDATLFSANLTVKFMKEKLRLINSCIGKILLKNLDRRLSERIDENYAELATLLSTAEKIPSKGVINLATRELLRLFEIDLSSENEFDSVAENDNVVSMEEELGNILKTAKNNPKIKNNNYKDIKAEFGIFANSGQRTKNLNILYDALSAVKPTSTAAERSFSVCTHFCQKLRSRLGDNSIDALVFLKYYFIRKK